MLITLNYMKNDYFIILKREHEYSHLTQHKKGVYKLKTKLVILEYFV